LLLERWKEGAARLTAGARPAGFRGNAGRGAGWVWCAGLSFQANARDQDGNGKMTILKMNPEEYAVSAEYLIPFMEVMKKRGFSEEQLLDGTGVRQGCWREAKSRVSATLLRRVADRKSTRLNSSHVKISYAVFCLKKKRTGTN